jgi:DNA mismatch repair protein MutL
VAAEPALAGPQLALVSTVPAPVAHGHAGHSRHAGGESTSSSATQATAAAAAWPLGRAVAQVHGVYILAENAQGTWIVDMHAAHERIVYERLKAQLGNDQPIASQPLLIPATFAATPQEVATAEAHADALRELGLEVAPFSPKTLAVRAVPSTLAQGDAVAGAQRAGRAGAAGRQRCGAARTQRDSGHHGLPRRRARQPPPHPG